MTGSRNEKEQGRRRRVRLHEATLDNDIRYRGPLSFIHFQILGWLCILISQVVLLLRLAGRVNAEVAIDTATCLSVLNSVAHFSLPFLLIAVFAQLLDTENGYMKMIVKNGAAMAGICGLSYIVLYRYIVGGFGAFLEDPGQAAPVIQALVRLAFPAGFVSFNIFVDLFLCALAMLFLNYNPRRVFTGKAHIFFRLLALLPVAYEAGCMVLKARAARGLVVIPVWAWSLLPVKPPMTFVLFIALALFIKTRERRFRRHGKTHEEYRAFLKTRRNSWNFSVFLSIMLVIVSVVDFTLFLSFSMGEAVQSTAMRVRESVVQAAATESPTEEPAEALRGDPTDAEGDPLARTDTRLRDAVDFDALETALTGALQAQPADPEAPGAAATEAPQVELSEDEMLEAAFNDAMQDDVFNASLYKGMSIAQAIGFGGSANLILLAPLVLLFSYTRKPKYPWLSLIVPAVGMALIFVVYLEGIHRILYILPVGKINLEELKDMNALYSGML